MMIISDRELKVTLYWPNFSAMTAPTQHVIKLIMQLPRWMDGNNRARFNVAAGDCVSTEDSASH